MFSLCICLSAASEIQLAVYVVHRLSAPSNSSLTWSVLGLLVPVHSRTSLYFSSLSTHRLCDLTHFTNVMKPLISHLVSTLRYFSALSSILATYPNCTAAGMTSVHSSVTPLVSQPQRQQPFQVSYTLARTLDEGPNYSRRSEPQHKYYHF